MSYPVNINTNEVTVSKESVDNVIIENQSVNDVKMVNKVKHRGEFKLKQLCGNLKRCFDLRVRVVSVVDDNFLKIADSTGCANFRKDSRFPIEPGDDLVLENCREKVDNMSVYVYLMRGFGKVRKLDDVIDYVTTPDYSDIGGTLIFPSRKKKKK